ncbi:hypothetical protein BU23DRAFT_301073 [Bimuria novae-zelandiae CBS 107.79]|uniref:Uncharacterized protein n=1 Tax=Bimuria novae-zelandiae CBS 107.79 TaxID=1447943 RepID=A0A6A5UR74_9PLEO|nr:hypothetical protein BU23DRAFT_301073 [Bimuria novae-zelandiae CBS 107.79]
MFVVSHSSTTTNPHSHHLPQQSHAQEPLSRQQRPIHQSPSSYAHPIPPRSQEERDAEHDCLSTEVPYQRYGNGCVRRVRQGVKDGRRGKDEDGAAEEFEDGFCEEERAEGGPMGSLHYRVMR